MVALAIRTFSKRFSHHKTKSNTCSSKQIIDIGDSYIELIEDVPCDNKNQLIRREGQLIRSMDCVNKLIAGRTRQEWDGDNRERVDGLQREWRKNNRESVNKLGNAFLSQK